jgi:hypothetical protein
MRALNRIHRYVSCFIAPAMLFFAVSGAWQAFRLQETRKDGSYVAPRALALLSDIHKAERLSGTAGTLFRAGQAALAAAFVVTAVLGLVMGFRMTRPRWPFWACLVAGILLPVVLAWIRKG